MPWAALSPDPTGGCDDVDAHTFVNDITAPGASWRRWRVGNRSDGVSTALEFGVGRDGEAESL